MLKSNAQSRLYCVHYVPANIHCPDCHSTEKDYINRPLYAPLYLPLSNLSKALDSAQLELPKNFYGRSNNHTNLNDLVSEDFVEIQTKDGIVRVPRSTLVDRPPVEDANVRQPSQTFPGDFQKHAHRFTRSFSWKTKPEESSFAQMQPLPKLIKRPDYAEICCKNICWPAHQLCLCCGRNTAEGCRKWSKPTEEYDYRRACRSACALCSDDAYKILDTPIVYNEKIIDPEVLLPLDAELLYYSIQSAKRQQEKQQNSSARTGLAKSPQSGKKKSLSKITMSFRTNIIDFKELKSLLGKLESSLRLDKTSRGQRRGTPSKTGKSMVKKAKRSRKGKSSKSMKTKKSSKSLSKKPKKKSRKKSSRSRSKSKRKSSRPKRRSRRKSSRSREGSKRKSSRSKKRSRRKSRRKRKARSR